MSKRTNYSKASYKAKSPKSIRYNILDFAAAAKLSGRTTVQSMWDYLLSRYLVEMGVRVVAPIDAVDTRPIDERILEIKDDAAFESQISLFKRGAVIGDVFAQYKDLLPKGSTDYYKAIQMDEPQLDEMPMWTPKPKTETAKVENNDDYVESEMRRLKEIQERTAKLKGGKKK